VRVYVAANPTATGEFNRYPGQVFRSIALFVGFFFRVLRVCRKHQNDDIILWYMLSGAWNLEPFVSILSFTSQGLLEVSEPQHHALWYMVSSRRNLEPFVSMLSFTSHLTWNLNSRVCAKHLLHPRVCRR
jgi:hypothetical protein